MMFIGSSVFFLIKHIMVADENEHRNRKLETSKINILTGEVGYAPCVVPDCANVHSMA